jgi:UDPglucose--hexose-1-phosphate uridylyltransferase
VFDNDFPALLPDVETRFSTNEVIHEPGGFDFPELFVAEKESGICRVVCFSPQHNSSLLDLPIKQVEAVVRTWIDQTLDLGKRKFIRYIQVFENKGAMMGASNPHPHCQIWATNHIPNEPMKELATQREYFARNGDCLLCDYLQAEKRIQERIVLENEHFTALVPFWAVWPFEIMVLANRHVSSLPELSPPEIEKLADILKRLTTRYDNLFEISFPYSMGFHQSPQNTGQNPEWHLHAHYYPPLLRSATVRKFMVGFEMLASPQRDVTPEHAAERLRSLSEVLYRGSR